MAAPHAVGAAAMVIGAGIRDINGDGRINDEVRTRLRATARDIGAPGYDERTGWGRVDAARAASFCRADVDYTAALDIFDFLAFQNLFARADPAADFTGDGLLDLFDFLLFQNEFAAGCP
jgi:hypothetical protein